MKILFISNLYPPHCIGGYEQLACDVANGLKKKGHSILVLTSTYGVNKIHIDNGVYRVLELEKVGHLWEQTISKWERAKIYFHDIKWLKKVVRIEKPDLIFSWNMKQLPRMLLVALERNSKKIPIVYFFADEWLKAKYKCDDYWHNYLMDPPDNIIKKLGKQIISVFLTKHPYFRDEPLKLKNIICGSQNQKQSYLEAGLPVEHAEVIHEAISLKQFYPPPNLESVKAGNGLRLIYSGQLTKAKGVHTAIMAVSILVREKKIGKISLTIVGSGKNEYLSYLKKLVNDHKLNEKVVFTGKVSREKQVELFHQHDILLFPSYLDSFPLTVLQGMACHLPVVGAAIDGTKEIIKNGENGFLFEPEDYNACACLIEKIIYTVGLKDRFIRNGEKTVNKEFNLDVMVDRIDSYLRRIINT